MSEVLSNLNYPTIPWTWCLTHTWVQQVSTKQTVPLPEQRDVQKSCLVHCYIDRKSSGNKQFLLKSCPSTQQAPTAMTLAKTPCMERCLPLTQGDSFYATHREPGCLKARYYNTHCCSLQIIFLNILFLQFVCLKWWDPEDKLWPLLCLSRSGSLRYRKTLSYWKWKGNSKCYFEIWPLDP